MHWPEHQFNRLERQGHAIGGKVGAPWVGNVLAQSLQRRLAGGRVLPKRYPRGGGGGGGQGAGGGTCPLYTMDASDEERR